MDIGYYNSYLEVDLGAIRDNVKKVMDHVGPTHGFIPIVKGNAYGMGTVPVATTLINDCKVPMVGSAQIYESAQIREAGHKDVDLLVLGAAPFHAIPYAVDYNLQLPIFNKESAKVLSDAVKAKGKTAQKIHIKIETGLNRIGVKPGDDLEALLKYIKDLGNLEIDGVFTHYSKSTEYQNEFTKEQFARFEQAVEQMAAQNIKPRYVHTANTGATVWFKEAHCTHVRNGSLYLGYSSMDDYSNPLKVKESSSWRCFITNIHEVVPGESVGYSRYFKPEKPTMVACIDIGYADGFYRPLAMQYGPVLVGDTKTRYLGMCMDQTFVDVTGIDCKLGDEVTIFGYSKNGTLLSAFEIEKFTGQSFVYPLCSPNARVTRVYKG